MLMYEQGKVKRFNEKKLKRNFSKQVLRKEHGSKTSRLLGNYDRPTDDRPSDRPTNGHTGS